MKFQTISFFSALLIILLYTPSTYSQVKDTISLNTIISKIETHGNKHPQEKVHLHFDKPYYAVGDTMWFKGYITAGSNTPSPFSKIVYVDVLNSRDSLMQSLKLPVTNGLAWGNIGLPASNYTQGNYYIRAYTRWMMNFDPDYFFKKTIGVGNGANEVNTHITFKKSNSGTNAQISYKTPTGSALANRKITWSIDNGDKSLKGKATTDQKGMVTISLPGVNNLSKQQLVTVIELEKKPVTSSFSLKSAESNIDLQFFPESGDLVTDIPSKVAFKALKANGLGINVKGTIFDNEGKAVTDFSSQHLGMGTFVLVPQNGKSYTAKITSPANLTGTYNLPKVKSSGITISANNSSTSETLNLRFICNNEFFAANQNKAFYLMANSGGIIYYAANISLKKQVFSAAIPKDKFPTGIVQLTVLSASGEPQCERLVFVRQPDELALALKTEKTTYGKRQKVKLYINSKNGKLPAESNLSVSVIDETKVPFDENSETTILSNLLLTSDLKGFIEKPNYYFNKPTEKTDEDLDILMLTQGYRRFSYSDIVNDKKPPIYFLPEQGIEITGILRNSTGMPLNKANVRLKIPEKYYTAYAVTNGSGVFKFPNVVISDSTEVIVSSADYSNKNPMLTVDPIGVQPAFSNVSAPDAFLNIDSAMSKYLQNNQRVLRNSRVLSEVVIKSAPKTADAPSHKDYGNLSGLSAWPDHLISKDRLTGCNNFYSCMQTMLTGVTFDNENFYVSRDYNAGNRTPMQIFYNGMPVDVNYLNSINSAEIESVEIFLKDQLGTVNRTYQSNGALVINSKRVEKAKKMSSDEIRRLLPKPGEIKFTPAGYSVTREFYSPKYGAPSAEIIGSDLRTTIYWDPKVKTDKTTGNTMVEFYNADGKGTYKVIVEGLDALGHLGRQIYRYKVE
ncbi:MAG: carboxypeptidase-like regulatory domain-containing protein [Sphingobacteriaceae bacterium]